MRAQGKDRKRRDYVQENGLKGHSFHELEGENGISPSGNDGADTRIHGTSGSKVGSSLRSGAWALQPLPVERFPFFHEGQRIVHRDGHVEVAKAYYSVRRSTGAHALVRWDLRLVRSQSRRMEHRVHVRQGAGRFSTQNRHIASEKRSGVERGAVWYLSRVAGSPTHAAGPRP